jgi:hypothetical protein
MEITGTVVDQANGLPLQNVTIWEISPDGQNASVIGFTGAQGKFDVFASNAGSNLNFVTDGYTGVNIPVSQAILSDQVLLQKEGTVFSKFTLSSLPSWVWLLAAGLGFYLLTDKRKK